MDLNLKKFDITRITDDSVVIFIGRRRTGKSFLLRDVMYYHQDLPIGTVISGSESANTFFANIVPSLFIHDEYSPDIISNVYKRQELVKRKVQKDIGKKGKSNIDPRAFLILDDLMFDDTWIRDKNVKRLFFNGRHFNLMFLITMQYPLGIPPNLRTNVDYVFILRENYIKNRKIIYENYAGMFPSFEMFCECMDACTENYECLVIHVSAESNKLQDQVFWYKATAHEDFKIGAKEFWDAHNANYTEEDGATEDTFDPQALRKKRGPKVNIQKKF